MSNFFKDLFDKIAGELGPQEEPATGLDVPRQPDMMMENLDDGKGQQPILIDKLLEMTATGSPDHKEPIVTEPDEENLSSNTAGYKVASLISFSLEKKAGLLDTAMYAGKLLMKSKAVRNAAIGAGIGALGGAATAGEGNRLSGALKGGLLGGLAGGAGTLAAKGMQTEAFKNAPNLASKLTALKSSAANDLKPLTQMPRMIQSYHGADDIGKSLMKNSLLKARTF